MMDLTNDRAFAIKVGERYFVRHGKRGRVLTAWSLAGARLFLPCTTEFDTAYNKLCQSGHSPRVVAVTEETYVNPNPNLITESGREHLSLADRLGLLEADVLDLQLRRPTFERARQSTWHPVHQFCQLLGNIRACINACRDANANAATSWGLANLSKTECRILAWRRGGVEEYDRVTNLAYPRATGVPK